ncbi:hypothetical protein DACRYDRAFT_20126 [Dacryopinax primogenitus]|uniref:Uncharacterized protein n=1 Tax=Dacryopinax primogenitus (strain DJM 731) TaxID=1858805 RepID=M5GA96_DACPD|nr:uncharacterized protein DACRYDRAFT_20126 [Dacryopinax primogenitus]EJU05734.1 hypothetical protein DACRYDRAFT_20126 [Dacryopinax primogenitus]
MDRLQRYRNDVASNDPPLSPTSSMHVSRPPRLMSSLSHQSTSGGPQLAIETASPTRINSSYRFPPSPIPGSPGSPRVSRSAVRSSNHSLLAQLDSPNMPSSHTMGIPDLPAEYKRGRTSESSSRFSAAQRSRSHGRPSLSHTRSTSSMSSNTTTSSSSSSLFDRPARAGSIAGSETSDDSRSITSVESKKSTKALKSKPSGLSLRTWSKSKTRVLVEGDEDETIPPVPPIPSLPATATVQRQPSFGPTLWERLVETATLSAKDWTFYGAQDDENEPTTPGGETHLTAVLKTYYVDRASTRDDLPFWLFEDKERNVPTPMYSASTQYFSPLETPRTGTTTPGTVVPATASTVKSNHSLRDIYESYMYSPKSAEKVKVRSPTPATRAQNRLRELRDAKRLGNLAVVDLLDNKTMRPLLSAGLASRPKSHRVPAGPKTGRI